MKKDDTESEFLISIKDLTNILIKGRKQIIICALAFSFLLGFYSMIKPIYYKAEGSFKEKSNSPGGFGQSILAQTFLSGLGTPQKSEAMSMMKSRKFLYRLIKEMGLQAQVVEKGTKSSTILGNLIDNIKVEWSYFRSKNSLPLQDATLPIQAKNVAYSGELSKSLQIVFESNDTFKVYGVKNVEIGTGVVDREFASDDYSFTITKTSDQPLASKVFFIGLTPLYNVAYSLSKALMIDLDKTDSQLVRISYNHRDRHFAADLINQLMLQYQNFLRNELRKITSQQVTYLNDRELEMNENLRVMLDEYAQMMSTEVSDMGHPDTKKALDFFSSLLANYEEEIMAVELELKRLDGLNEQKDAGSYFRYQYEKMPGPILDLITKMRNLKQRSDSIELAIRNSNEEDLEHWQKTFSNQLADLENFKKCNEEANVILASLENDVYPIPLVNILDHPKYMVRSWYDRLLQYRESCELVNSWEKGIKEHELEQFKEQFVAYVKNLIHHLDVSEKAVSERLIHQQAPQFEFQGINLNTADELYLRYSKELNTIESDIVQLKFVIEQLKNPEFEISSLSAVTQDPITTGMINRSSEYVLAIQDESNRSVKEKERLQNELQIQKKFLQLHLSQTIDLLRLREGLIKDKIQSLQKSSLELIQQQVSIFERELLESIDNHIVNLKQKKELNEQQKQKIRNEMTKIPKRWAQEKLIEQELKMESGMLEELTKLVESKNISINLEMIQSAPIDFAVALTKPERPRLRLFVLFGAFLGAFMMIGVLLARAILFGLTATVDNLELLGVHVSGTITRSSNNEKTYRRFVSYIFGSDKKTIALINGNSYITDIAKIIAKRGRKPLVIDFSPYHTNEQQEITRGEFFDTLSISSNNILDFICTDEFLSKLDDLKKKYDWVVANFNIAASDPEVEMIYNTFDNLGIFVYNESLQSLQNIITLAKDSSDNKKVSFFEIAQGGV